MQKFFKSNYRHLAYALTWLCISSWIWFKPFSYVIYNTFDTVIVIVMIIIKAMIALLVFGLGVVHFINWLNNV